jgi:hypothetical protein
MVESATALEFDAQYELIGDGEFSTGVALPSRTELVIGVELETGG